MLILSHHIVCCNTARASRPPGFSKTPEAAGAPRPKRSTRCGRNGNRDRGHSRWIEPSNRTTYVNRLTYVWQRSGFSTSDSKYSNDRRSRTQNPPGSRSALIHDCKAGKPSRLALYWVCRAPATLTTLNWAVVAWLTRNSSCSGNVMMRPNPYITAHCVRR